MISIFEDCLGSLFVSSVWKFTIWLMYAKNFRDPHGIATKTDKILSVFMICIAAFANLVAIYSDAYALFTKNASRSAWCFPHSRIESNRIPNWILFRAHLFFFIGVQYPSWNVYFVVQFVHIFLKSCPICTVVHNFVSLRCPNWLRWTFLIFWALFSFPWANF